MATLPARLTIVTGKGGVGKTTISLALTKNLQSKGLKAKYLSFNEALDDNLPLGDLQSLKVPFIPMKLSESTEAYIALKLNSELLASWIMKTPFFNAVFNMVPALGHIIILGHIIKKLIDDPELYIVLDSPSSGHAMTMFESVSNFEEIFGSGALFNDVRMMKSFLSQKGNLKTYICTLPTLLAFQEAKELESHLSSLNMPQAQLILNNSLLELTKNWQVELPEFLESKKEIEQSVLSKRPGEIPLILPHSTGLEFLEVVEFLIPYMDNLSLADESSEG